MIVYCEGNVDGTVGGSYYLLYDLVRSLDPSKYYPIVTFYTDNLLVPKLRDSGIETHVFHRPDPIILCQQKKNQGVFGKVAYLFTRPLQRILNIVNRLILPAIKISRFLKACKADMVNLNNSITRNHEWFLACKIVGVPCTTHEMGINENFSFMTRYWGRRTAAIFSLSNAITGNMRQKGCDWSHIYTIHCGIDLSRYQIKRTPEKIRSLYSIDKDDPVIGVVGNIKLWKGQETVIRAVALVIEHFPTLKCLLVGGSAQSDMPYHKRLEELCEDFNIKQHVIFTGFQPNPIDFMNTMDIVIHSSILPEPFGIVNLEAMSLKKPIISTKIGAPLEIFEDGISGYLVTPGKPDELARCIENLLSNREHAHSIGSAAYKRLKEKFTLDDNVRKTVAIYRHILR